MDMTVRVRARARILSRKMFVWLVMIICNSSSLAYRARSRHWFHEMK